MCRRLGNLMRLFMVCHSILFSIELVVGVFGVFVEFFGFSGFVDFGGCLRYLGHFLLNCCSLSKKEKATDSTQA